MKNRLPVLLIHVTCKSNSMFYEGRKWGRGKERRQGDVPKYSRQLFTFHTLNLIRYVLKLVWSDCADVQVVLSFSIQCAVTTGFDKESFYIFSSKRWTPCCSFMFKTFMVVCLYIRGARMKFFVLTLNGLQDTGR